MVGRIIGVPNEALLSFRRLVLNTHANAPQVGPSDLTAGSRLRQERLQQATADVMEEFLKHKQPRRLIAFASATLKTPSFFVDLAGGKRLPHMLPFNLPSDLPDIPSTSLHYRLLLESTARLRSADSSRRVLNDFFQRKMQIDKDIYYGLARLVFSTIGTDVPRMVEALQEILPDFSDKTESTTPSRMERRARLMKLARTLQEHGLVDRLILSCVRSTDITRAYDRTNRYEVRDQEHDNSKLEPRNRRRSKFSRHDDVLAWLLEDSSALFRGSVEEYESVPPPTVEELRVPLTSDAYAFRIRTYAIVRRDYQSAQAVYAAMMTHGIKPTYKHINPLIEGLLAVGRIREAHRLRQNAHHRIQYVPNLMIHTKFIRAYVQQGDFQSIRREIEELHANGLELSDSIFNIIEAARVDRRTSSLSEIPVNPTHLHHVTTRFQSLMQLPNYVAAQKLLKTALDAGIKPDRVLYDVTRKAFQYIKKRRERLKEHLASFVYRRPRARSASNADSFVPHHSRAAVAHIKLTRTNLQLLSEAIELGAVNRKRLRKRKMRNDRLHRFQIRSHRRKVLQLILDFAEGDLEREAQRALEQQTQVPGDLERKAQRALETQAPELDLERKAQRALETQAPELDLEREAQRALEQQTQVPGDLEGEAQQALEQQTQVPELK